MKGRLAVKIAFLLSLFIIVTPALSYAAPQIRAISPEKQRPGETITITGSDFGAAGFVKFTGLKAQAQSWSGNSITAIVPQGASSGAIQVIDNLGGQSNAYKYTIDLSSLIQPVSWGITDPEQFNLKDFGYFGSANRIEANKDAVTGKEYLYLHYSTGVATYETTVLPYRQKSNFYLPSKMADWKIFGDYIFMAGDFGLRIYKLSELQTQDQLDPPLAGAYTGLTFRYVAIQRYDSSRVPIMFNGVPFNGVLVAASEFYDQNGSPRIFFFKWDEGLNTLELLSIYDGRHFQNSLVNKPEAPLFFKDRKLTFCLALDPLNPKLYVVCGTKTLQDAGKQYNYLYEFNIAEISSIGYNGDLRINDDDQTPSDMEVFHDKLWLAFTGTSISGRAFNGYDLHPDSLIGERTYINSCDPGTGACFIDHLGGYLDIIEEDGLVAGITGMSADDSKKHNIFLFKVDAQAGQHMPLASSESIDWSQDVAAIPGKIHIADEWVNALSLSYNYDGALADIIHHVEPGWLEPTRIFGGGWFSVNIWEHNGRLYGGDEKLISVDANRLGDFTKWRQWRDKWNINTGRTKGEYIFALGYLENFIMQLYGTDLLIIREDPQTEGFSLVNGPEPAFHYPPKFFNIYFNSFAVNNVSGYSTNVHWLEDNVVFFTIPDHGLFAYYIDPENGVLLEKAKLPLAEKANYWFGAAINWLAQTFTDVEPVSSAILAVSGSWATNCGNNIFAPEPDWGGISFYEISYPDGLPPAKPDALNPDADQRRVAFNLINTVNCLKGKRVDSLTISKDGWIGARVYWEFTENSLFKTGFINVIFRYEDVVAMNAQADQEAVFKGIILPYANFNPPIVNALGMSKGIREACFWQADKIVVPVGAEQTDSKGYTGVYVFNRESKQQLYYYPAGRVGHQYYGTNHFSFYPDSNVQLVPNPWQAIPAANGDVFIATGWAGQIARLGKPGPGLGDPGYLNSADIDMNGAVNITDITLCANAVFSGANPPNPPAADVNKDGLVNIVDLTIVVNTALGNQ